MSTAAEMGKKELRATTKMPSLIPRRTGIQKAKLLRMTEMAHALVMRGKLSNEVG